ncbi:MAG: YbjN domain-containing protein [Magnetococcales bacterium]|nr:YbjN domain-containing protein [Nitrospirota bacterium]
MGKKKKSEKTIDEVISMVDTLLEGKGIDVASSRYKDNRTRHPYWVISRGSAVIFVRLFIVDDITVISIESPVVFLPDNRIVAIYRRCLELNMYTNNCAFAVVDDIIYLVNRRPIEGLDIEELEFNLDTLSYFADKYDNEFADEFGARIFTEHDPY